MRIFADDMRFSFARIPPQPFQLLMARIHCAVHIGDGSIPVLFIMNQPGRIIFLHEPSCRHKIAAKAGLISQRPDKDTGVVFIPAHHALHTIQVACFPQHILAETVHFPFNIGHLVALQIRLLHHIKAHTVA